MARCSRCSVFAESNPTPDLTTKNSRPPDAQKWEENRFRTGADVLQSGSEFNAKSHHHILFSKEDTLWTPKTYIPPFGRATLNWRGELRSLPVQNRGIGKGIALRLARERIRVVINGRDPERTQAAAAELRSVGAEALAIPADIGVGEDITRLFDEVMRTWGRVDLLVNNAADLRRRKFFEVDEALLDAELAAISAAPTSVATGPRKSSASIMGEASSTSVPWEGCAPTGAGCPMT